MSDRSSGEGRTPTIDDSLMGSMGKDLLELQLSPDDLDVIAGELPQEGPQGAKCDLNYCPNGYCAKGYSSQ